MSTDYSRLSREWQYEEIPRRIVAERFIEEPGGLKDYKIYCFNGIPRYILVILGRDRGHPTECIFNTDWELQDFTRHHQRSDELLPRPNGLEKMLDTARVLSTGFPFVRVDMYNPGDQVIFGEMTFHPGNGVNDFQPPKTDLDWGELINLEPYK